MNNAYARYQAQLQEERILTELAEQQSLLEKQMEHQDRAADRSILPVDEVSRQTQRERYTRLRRIQQAKERLLKGRYGVCLGCSNPINPDRLKYMPYAELCINCQSKNHKLR